MEGGIPSSFEEVAEAGGGGTGAGTGGIPPPLSKLWKPGVEAPEQEDGIELQGEPQEEQLRLMKRAGKT